MKTHYDMQSRDWQHARGLLIDTNLQAMDIKHIAEYENIYRQRCKLAISIYKNWIKTYQQETDVVELLYGSVEGMMLKQQAQDAVTLYWIVRKDFKQALQNYLGNVTRYQNVRYAA